MANVQFCSSFCLRDVSSCPHTNLLSFVSFRKIIPASFDLPPYSEYSKSTSTPNVIHIPSIVVLVEVVYAEHLHTNVVMVKHLTLDAGFNNSLSMK
ncbi:hypothetical protein HOLleu_09457 [Holothuria leucospilota]|uniref:Uncharacterized protein n=1 Tax=Holothuria leucospilota TaxID=206669 RepID=A0A9Q1HE54_HOLLE|nr:hypothetical protein HOLleu_09457 [Holothuria leucospilota]